MAWKEGACISFTIVKTAFMCVCVCERTLGSVGLVQPAAVAADAGGSRGAAVQWAGPYDQR